MDDARLRQLASQTGIPLKKIAEWHFIHGPHCESGLGGRKQRRPKGTLSLGDIVAKHDVPMPMLQKWRSAGLKSQRKSQMVLIKEEDLVAWMQEHPFVRRPLGRPKGC
jgi:hypothetical protein